MTGHKRIDGFVRVALAIVLAGITSGNARGQHATGTVRFEGRALFRVWGSTAGAAEDRARRVERRLALLVEQSGERDDAVIRTQDSERMIYVGPVLIATVTPLDAEESLTTADVLAAEWSRAIDDALERARARRLSWGRFAAGVAGSVRTAFGRVAESAIMIIPRLMAGLLVILMFWAVASAARTALGMLLRALPDRTTASFVRQVAYYAIWALGLVVGVHAVGFEPSSVIAGLGLTSLALGFALKDILSNLLSGVLMLALRPFEIGDQIVVGDTEGAVERIRLRATHIRTYDGRLVQVPNAELFTSRVTNNTASPQRRTSVELPLPYNTDAARALAVARDTAGETEGVLGTHPVTARIRGLGEADMLLDVQFWTDSRRSDVVTTAAAVRANIVTAFQRDHIPLPDASRRSVTFEGNENAVEGRARVAVTGENRPADRGRL